MLGCAQASSEVSSKLVPAMPHAANVSVNLKDSQENENLNRQL